MSGQALTTTWRGGQPPLHFFCVQGWTYVTERRDAREGRAYRMVPLTVKDLVVGAASSPRFAPGTALLQDGILTAFQQSGIRTG